MRNLLLCIALFFALPSVAQSEYNYTSQYEFISRQYDYLTKQVPKNVKQIDLKFTRTRKGKVHVVSRKFNEIGQLTDQYTTTESGEIQPSLSRRYGPHHKVDTSQYYKKGRLNSTTIYDRREDGKPLTKISLDRKQKIKFYNTWAYSASGCLSGSANYKKGKDNLRNRWVYEYYEGCNKSKSTLYNRKGKVINTWTYDCKQEGEILQKKKNETQVCRWEESTDSTLIKVYQTFDEKGRVRKYVSHYTLKDTLILKHFSYNEQDVLLSHNTYDRDYSKPLTEYNYRKGKIRASSIYRYENGRIIHRSHRYKGSIYSETSYRYNAAGLLDEVRTFGKKGRLSTIVDFTYHL